MKNIILALSFVVLSVMGSGCSVSLLGRPMVTGGYTGTGYGSVGTGGVGYGAPPVVATPGGMTGTIPYGVVVNVSNYYGGREGGTRTVAYTAPGLGAMTLAPGSNSVRIPDVATVGLDFQCSNGTIIHRTVVQGQSLGYTVISNSDCGWNS